AILSCAVCCWWIDDIVVVPVFMVAAGLALAVSTIQRSFELAYRDELTGLPGRRALNDRLVSPGKVFVLAMVDIDRFKRVNDTYGHDVGDHVLRFVASRLRQSGGGGKAYRYGGEEFVLFFPRQSLRDVVRHLDNVREMVGGYELRVRGRDRPASRGSGRKRRGKEQGSQYVSVTVSIGAAGRVDRSMTVEDVLAEADKALYRAKKTGRDKVCFGRRRRR
ncbi:MAG: GGDEF domain-containing protein, partial [Lentisphaerae bacterium]|nr:GGDEF domain-containing protein [Lentisphaerota bacterium]